MGGGIVFTYSPIWPTFLQCIHVLQPNHGTFVLHLGALKMATELIGSGPPYFRGGVTPAGRGTCATFRVIDTRL